MDLQEVFLPKDRAKIFAELKANLPYKQYFRSGLLGSGLSSLSRFPIIATEFIRFRLNGLVFDFSLPDYLAGKGVGIISLKTPVGQIKFINTHILALYKDTRFGRKNRELSVSNHLNR